MAYGTVRGPEPSKQERVGLWTDGLPLTNKPDLEACLARGIRDASVSAAVGVSDRAQTPARDGLEHIPPVAQRARKRGGVERRKRVMAEGVKADLHPAGSELSHIVGPYPCILGIGPQRVCEASRHLIALLGRHRFDNRPELVERGRLRAESRTANQPADFVGV